MDRRYTKFYGVHGDAAADIAHDAILGNLLLFTIFTLMICFRCENIYLGSVIEINDLLDSFKKKKN